MGAEDLPDFDETEQAVTKDVVMGDAEKDASATKTADTSAEGDATKDAAAEPAPLDEKTTAALHSSGFRDFLLKPEVLRAIVDNGFEHPSEVQHEALPQAILGNDLLCQAKSGMGKTAVFVIACLQQVSTAEDCVRGIVVVHTRELAYQIKNEFERFSKFLPLVRIGCVYGGTPFQTDKDLVSGNKCPHILIGTPGRINGLMREEALNLDKVTQFVLDECDRCVEKADMRYDIQKIFTKTPKNKQVMMFTATFSEETKSLCRNFMVAPFEVKVEAESKLTLAGLLQYYTKMDELDKNKKLNVILDTLEFNQVVIFVKSVQRCIALHRLLETCNFPAIAIHSQLTQDERIQKYKEFKNFEKRIMIATDLFGRGIDIERVNIVVNYDMTDESDQYLHRVGRAGRFGTKGLAISFITSDEDQEVLDKVKSRFSVNIPTMPEKIDVTSYLNA